MVLHRPGATFQLTMYVGFVFVCYIIANVL